MRNENDGGFGLIVGISLATFYFVSLFGTNWLAYSIGKGNSNPELLLENKQLRLENSQMSIALFELERKAQTNQNQICIGLLCGQNNENK